MFEKIVHDRTASAVARQFEELILDGVLRPGERLPGERELAEELDVSRPILRTAIKALEAEGLLRSRHGEGTFVAEIIGTVFEQPMVSLVRRNPRAVFEYLEFRREVEALAAGHAAARATRSDIDILTRIIEAMEAAHAAGDPHEEARLDVEFHAAINEAAHNLVLLHMMRACYRLMSEGVFHNRELLYANPKWREALLDQHRAIFSAIRSGKPGRARKAAEEHIAFVEDALRTIDRDEAREAVAARRLNNHERRVGRSLRTGAGENA